MKYKDYYETLGLDKGATQDQIKKAFRKLAKKYHPDANPGNNKYEEKFKEINEAYEVLGDEEKRKKYDQFGHNFNFSNGYDFDPSQFGFGNNVRYEYKTSNNDFSDFFNMFFGDQGFDLGGIFGGMNDGGAFGRKYSTHRAARGQDVEAQISVTPEEAFNGLEKRITVNTGSGKKTINFKIPPGIKNGGKIKLSGQGGKSINGGPNGDLYLNVELSGGRFEIKGPDAYVNQEIYPWDAALGGEATVLAFDGRIKVKIPAGIQTESKIRISGKGYKTPSGNRGDLYIVVKIVNPKTLTDKQRKLYEELKKT